MSRLSAESLFRERAAIRCHLLQTCTDRSECGTEDDFALKYWPLHPVRPQTARPSSPSRPNPLVGGRSVGRARSSRHKAILVNKAARPVGWSEKETALVYVFLLFLCLDQIQLHCYFSASTIYCLSLGRSLPPSPSLLLSLSLSLMPYFMPLAYNKTESRRSGERGRKEEGAVNR